MSHLIEVHDQEDEEETDLEVQPALEPFPIVSTKRKRMGASALTTLSAKKQAKIPPKAKNKGKDPASEVATAHQLSPHQEGALVMLNEHVPKKI